MRKSKIIALLLVITMSFFQITWAQSVPVVGQLPTGGQVVSGDSVISQNGVNMNIQQNTERAAIDWQTFDIGSGAQVNFNQPSNSSVALNRVLTGNPSQIFGQLTANGQVFLTNAAGVYFAPGSTVNVGGLIATTHTISNDDFMAGRNYFERLGAQGALINEGVITADLAGYVALLAPEARNQGVIIAPLGTVAMAAGEAYELQFNNQGSLTDITVSKSDIAALVDNKFAVQAPGGLIIMSAQAANHLQGGVVKNSGNIEASGMVNDGGVIRLVASDVIELGGQIKADAKADSSGHGGTVMAIADLSNLDSNLIFNGKITARAGDLGGDGGFVETSGSHLHLDADALVGTQALNGKTGTWLIDPYDYTIDASAATAIETALSGSNVTVTTAIDNAAYGSNGNNASAGDITVSSAINAAGAYLLTLTADNAINVSAAISTGALTLTGPGGITLNSNLSTLTGMTINGNITLGADVTLTSGVSNTYNAYSTYTVAAGVNSLTATLVGASGGKGGTDTSTGGDAGTVGVLTASFAVNPGDNLYIAPGSAGVIGGHQKTNTGGSAGGTNQFNLGNGGAGGDTGPQGNSGGGAGGGAATVLSLTNAPTTASALLVAGGGGGGGGSGNNLACPSLCGDQSSANYRSDNNMAGERGYHAGNGGSPINDGGGSGGGGGGLIGGAANQTIFFVNEWTGRGGNVGSSGAANGFTTTSLSTSLLSGVGNSQNGYAIISYGGGTIDINGTVNGAHALNIVARNSDVDISGAIGDGTALSSLSIVGAQGIGLSGGAVTTTGAQTYTGPLTLNAAATTMTATSNGNVTFASNILKGAGVASDLTVSAGSGSVNFNGQTGIDGTPIGAASITTTGTTTLAGSVYGTSFTKSGSGKTVISGGLVKTSGGQSYGGILDLGGTTTLNSTGVGNIVVSGAVSNNTQNNLTVTAAGGDVTFSGNFAVGTNARPTPIGDVSITASGTVNLGSSGTAISADAKSLSITANDTNIYANSSTSFTCGTGSSAVGICLTNTASFNISAASVFGGPLAGTTTLTKSGAGALTLTGVSTYSGNTTVNAGKLEISGTGKLGNGNYGGNIAVASQIRFANSVDQVLSGTISGAGYINSPGSGILSISTLSNVDVYNLPIAYVIISKDLAGSSSAYGDTVPIFSYTLATTSGGGTAFTAANPSGTLTLNNTLAVTSNVGSYSLIYERGLSLDDELYGIQPANTIAWTIDPRPLTVTVSKVYDGSTLFASGFTASGMVNSDAAPTLSGNANASSKNAATYTSFANSTLASSNSNYTLTGATVNATISPHSLNFTVSKVYDGSTAFSSGFSTSGMIGVEAAPTLSGSATVSSRNVGNYSSLTSNGLTVSDGNYTITGGTVDLTITQRPLDISVSKVFDGSMVFSKDFILTGMSGGDIAPLITGTASVASSGPGDYTQFFSSTLAINNTNYKLIGGAVVAKILSEPPIVPVIPTVPKPESVNIPELTLNTNGPIGTQNSTTGLAPLGSNSSILPSGQTSNSTPTKISSGNTSSNASSGTTPVAQKGEASSVTAAKQEGITVSMVQEPSAKSSGMINVLVPKDTIARTGGFSFPLPEKVSAPGASNLNITMVGGEPLPSWLVFNPQTKTFTATSVPSGGLPLQVVIITGDTQTTIVIGERS